MLSLTQNNIKEIQNNVENYLKKSAKEEPKAEQAKPQEAKAASDEEKAGSKKVVIKKLTISNAKLSAAAMGQEVAVTLPMIEMKNIGEGSEKKSIPQVIAMVINKILTVASQTVVNSKLSNLENVAKENLKGVVGNVKDRVKELGIFGK